MVSLLDPGKGPLPWALLWKALYHTHTHVQREIKEHMMSLSFGSQDSTRIQCNFKIQHLLLWLTPFRTHGNGFAVCPQSRRCSHPNVVKVWALLLRTLEVEHCSKSRQKRQMNQPGRPHKGLPSCSIISQQASHCFLASPIHGSAGFEHLANPCNSCPWQQNILLSIHITTRLVTL